LISFYAIIDYAFIFIERHYFITLSILPPDIDISPLFMPLMLIIRHWYFFHCHFDAADFRHFAIAAAAISSLFSIIAFAILFHADAPFSCRDIFSFDIAIAAIYAAIDADIIDFLSSIFRHYHADTLSRHYYFITPLLIIFAIDDWCH
jgi:hypothetical protein